MGPEAGIDIAVGCTGAESCQQIGIRVSAVEIAVRQRIEPDQRAGDQRGFSGTEIRADRANAHNDVTDRQNFEVDQSVVLILIRARRPQNTVDIKVVLDLPEGLHAGQRSVEVATKEFA